MKMQCQKMCLAHFLLLNTIYDKFMIYEFVYIFINLLVSLTLTVLRADLNGTKF